MKPHFKIVVISDIHIGSRWSRYQQAFSLLEGCTYDTLVLNGDIFDGWHLIRNRKKWKQHYNNFIKTMIGKIATTKVIYIRGNHDDFLDYVVPFEIGNFSILSNYVYESDGKRYYIFHGDKFDNVTAKHRWISKIGDRLYSVMLQINRVYNDLRKYKGKGYSSISKAAKQKVKNWVSKHSSFDTNILRTARQNDCSGVICGHIHHPEIRQIEEILYINSGDWIESLSAVAQYPDGSWHLITIDKDNTIKEMEEPL